jgi:hypothetical protein
MQSISESAFILVESGHLLTPIDSRLRCFCCDESVADYLRQPARE